MEQIGAIMILVGMGIIFLAPFVINDNYAEKSGSSRVIAFLASLVFGWLAVLIYFLFSED